MGDIKAHVFNNLATLLGAGVGIVQALRTTGRGGRGGIYSVFRKMADDIASGANFTEAMIRQGKWFSRLEILAIQAGERSGAMVESLRLLARWGEFNGRLHRTIKSKMTLPFVVFSAAAFLIPLPEVFIGGLGLNDYPWRAGGMLAMMYIPLAALYGVIRFMPQRGVLRQMIDTLGMMVPVLGNAWENLAISRYCWTFHVLSQAGVSVVQTARHACDASGNAVVAGRLAGGIESARRGHPLSEGFAVKRLPAEFVEIWMVGEETGMLSESARRLGEIYAESAENTLVQAGTWIPRLVYFVIMIYLAYNVISIYSKMMGGYSLF